MNEARYIISDASRVLSVEPHVLRYWEEELGLVIPRNEMGHRYYRKSEIQTFNNIKQLKEHGFHLRAIKLLLPDLDKVIQLPEDKLTELKYEMDAKTTLPVPFAAEPPSIQNQDNKMEQFRQILSRIVVDAMKESESNITQNVSTQVTKEMDYMFRQKEEADEERYRTLDETIRSFQLARREAAASKSTTTMPKKRHKKGLLALKK